MFFLHSYFRGKGKEAKMKQIVVFIALHFHVSNSNELLRLPEILGNGKDTRKKKGTMKRADVSCHSWRAQEEGTGMSIGKKDDILEEESGCFQWPDVQEIIINDRERQKLFFIPQLRNPLSLFRVSHERYKRMLSSSDWYHERVSGCHGDKERTKEAKWKD